MARKGGKEERLTSKYLLKKKILLIFRVHRAVYDEEIASRRSGQRGK